MPYADSREAQNFARMVSGRPPLPPRSWWKEWGISVLIAIILGGYALAIGLWHGHTQSDIAAKYSETK